MSFGYIGPEPTNDATANNGIFTVEEINDLEENGKLASSAFDCDFLVVGGGGGAGNTGGFVGGGGAGGVCSSVQNQGGGNTLDSAVRLSTGVNYDVSVGAGGSINAYIGGASTFNGITGLGGGTGWRNDRSHGGGSGGGGGRAFTWQNYDRSIPRAMNDDDKLETFGSISRQGGDGNNTGYESYNSAGGGGGAAGNRGTTNAGTAGIRVEIASATNAALSGVGEVLSTNQVWYGGGGSAGANSGTTGGNGGGGNGGQNSGNAGQANTGGGGGGRNNTGYSGGSGCVVLKYPDTFNCTAGAGVTGTQYDEGNGFKTFHVTAGDGTISWSKA